MAKNDDVLSRFASAGNDAVDLINRVDTATSKFQPGQRKGSIVKSAQGNVFEFPVFISNSIPLDYATATTSLLEQIYAAYLQMAISLNPVIDASSVKNGLQFADFKTNTNKYLEYTDTTYQHDACHAVYQEDGAQFEFNMLSIEDADARLINEAVDHQPLSEFDHFFQEAGPADDEITDMLIRYPKPVVSNNSLEFDANGDPVVDWNELMTPPELFALLTDVRGAEILDENGAPTGEYHSAYDTYQNMMHSYNVEMPSKNDVAQFEYDRQRDRVKDQQWRMTYDNTKAWQAYQKKHNQAKDNFEHMKFNYQQQRDAVADALNNLRYGDRQGRVSYVDDVDNQRDINARAAQKATSPYYRATDAISTGARTASDVLGAVNAGANAVYNVGTLGTRIQNEKLNNQILKDRVDNLNTDRAIRKTEVNAKAMAKAPQYVDDAKCQKLNTMKPLLMNVTVNMLNKDDSLHPINYIVGVKTHMRVVPSSILPEVARYPLKEMDKLSRKVKWRAGELKFLKDLIFRIDEKKQTAADSRDPNRKWYRRLYELAHMKGDAPASAVVQGKSIFAAFIRDKQGKGKLKNGMIPNASIIMSQQDVDNIKNQTEIDLLKASNARKFCGELFLISLIIVDIDAESIKILLPDQNNDFDVHSLASVQKQLATLDTSGTKTRDMFKLLG
jgi:hypothetical protein